MRLGGYSFTASPTEHMEHGTISKLAVYCNIAYSTKLEGTSQLSIL
jgi:hypothetical protein